MSVLERPKLEIEETEKITANGRFFYNPEDPNESIHSRIINFTSKLFEHYKLNSGQDFTFVQLLRTDGEFQPIVMGAEGDNVSLKYNGTAIAGGSSPLWEVVIAHEDGRSVNQLMLRGGLHVIQRDYDHQGKLRHVEMQGDILSTWRAVEIILDDDLTHDYLINDIPDKHLRSDRSIDSDLTSKRLRLPPGCDQGSRSRFNCSYTPEEAKAKLNEIFEGENGAEFSQAYKDGMFHIVNLRKYDTPQAAFYVMVQILCEIAARLHDQATDDTI